MESKQKSLFYTYVFLWVYVNLCTVTVINKCIFVNWKAEGNVQPQWIIFNEVETKDLCTVRYSSTSNNGLLFCGFEVCPASRPSYLDRLCIFLSRWELYFCYWRLIIQSKLMTVDYSVDITTQSTNPHQNLNQPKRLMRLHDTRRELVVKRQLQSHQLSSTVSFSYDRDFIQ